jgi:hypothetical protein
MEKEFKKYTVLRIIFLHTFINSNSMLIRRLVCRTHDYGDGTMQSRGVKISFPTHASDDSLAECGLPLSPSSLRRGCA